KKLGRNRYQFFTEDLHSTAMARIARETELRHAMTRDELVLFYQPQVNAITDYVEGFEALVRWQHPVEGLIGPQEFIELAEETGMIGTIGEWVLREACRQTQQWRRQNNRDFHIGVNLSVDQFYTRNMVQMVKAILHETGLPPNKLLLEITESLALENDETHLQVLADLKDLKVQLALDDFGTGNSSLSYLKHFPVDMLKIDRSFVHGLGQDIHVEAIARATIALAESLDLSLVAEGVETQKQCDWLMAEGCEVIQGYLYARPMVADECLLWLQKHEARMNKPVKKNKRKRVAEG
ncbi:MAG TPA: EAL domain-containing protein, partial [Gammaproteobacteria bacterium]|nr:EAL domain-containing protein [Gammaproteobacteria bacterium]